MEEQGALDKKKKGKKSESGKELIKLFASRGNTVLCGDVEMESAFQNGKLLGVEGDSKGSNYETRPTAVLSLHCLAPHLRPLGTGRSYLQKRAPFRRFFTPVYWVCTGLHFLCYVVFGLIQH